MRDFFRHLLHKLWQFRSFDDVIKVEFQEVYLEKFNAYRTQIISSYEELGYELMTQRVNIDHYWMSGWFKFQMTPEAKLRRAVCNGQ